MTTTGATGAPAPGTADPHVMPCMEVWGGNQAVDCGVIMSGLDAWLYSRPFHGDDRGGDVHYVSSCATGRITRMLVADVSGHGAAVAETGAKLRHLMRRYVNHIDQSRFVAALNREFAAFSKQGGFATSVIGTFFAPTNELTLCNAGHPPPLLHRRKTATWSLVQQGEGGGDVPLGIVEQDSYQEQSVPLRVGDLLLCYTDSLIESEHPGGRQLGISGLLELVRGLDVSRPEKLIGLLLAAIADLSPENLKTDDVTVLLVRPNGLAPRVPVLEAMWLLARGLVRSMRPGGDPMPWPELSLTNIGGAVFTSLNRGKSGRLPISRE